ncbi:MAG: SDR family oxidoreductase [Oscillospiraceae bacterium]|jgi:3-oxoacyl-[acyl-carrier protein] reductase|nr:SDR family oxidoreductase [Oscillospiraceae bacterium]
MKNALVTGASRGIGAEIARRLAADGYSVIVNYNSSRETAEALAREIGGTALCADVSDVGAVTEMLRKSGEISALVCNAGVGDYGVFQDAAPRWREVFGVNFGGAVNAVSAAMPGMLRRGGGSIVFIGSVWGGRGASCESVYAASKAALHSLTRSLARELGPSGIRVNCVAPGVIDTDMNARFSPDEMAELASRAALGRIGSAEDVAGAVSFLCSESARFVTGQILGVDGGF